MRTINLLYEEDAVMKKVTVKFLKPATDKTEISTLLVHKDGVVRIA